MSESWKQDELPLGRLEAFSDGVFAIATSSSDARKDLLRAILQEWPSYLASITSFFTIGGV